MKKDRGVSTAPVPQPRIAHHQEDPDMLIRPAETVTVDGGALHTVVTTLRAAAHGEPFRHEITAATGLLREFLLIPMVLADHGPLTVEVAAEPLWWLVQGGEEIGHEHGLSPVSRLFDAVDHLGTAITAQAPRTDYGLTAVIEAEVTAALCEHVIAQEKKRGESRG
jgi:hypothetical protein